MRERGHSLCGRGDDVGAAVEGVLAAFGQTALLERVDQLDDDGAAHPELACERLLRARRVGADGERPEVAGLDAGRLERALELCPQPQVRSGEQEPGPV